MALGHREKMGINEGESMKLDEYLEKFFPDASKFGRTARLPINGGISKPKSLGPTEIGFMCGRQPGRDPWHVEFIKRLIEKEERV